MTTEQAACQKCGNCCKQGGPALHSQDLARIKSGKIPVSSLITIRKGELASNPLTGKIQPVAVELVKITGTGRQWACCCYDAESGCTVYADRPYACRLLKCWDTREILAVVEKYTLSRFDILGKGDPLVAVIKDHERICPCDDLGFVQGNSGLLSEEKKNELEKRVRADLRFRNRAIADFQLNVRAELFYFGRPLFQLLQQVGARIFETPAGIHLSWDK
jgi:Fe-S-cluster containining protein